MFMWVVSSSSFKIFGCNRRNKKVLKSPSYKHNKFNHTPVYRPVRQYLFSAYHLSIRNFRFSKGVETIKGIFQTKHTIINSFLVSQS